MRNIIILLCTCSLFAEHVDQSIIHSIGTTYAQYSSPLCCSVSGKTEDVFVDIGTYVQKGKQLLRLDPIFFTIDLQKQKTMLESAQITVDDAKRNFERMQMLFEKKDGSSPSISKKCYESAELAYKQALTQLKLQEQTLQRAEHTLEESIIKAPYSGVITNRTIHPGAPVQALQPVGLQIEHIDTLYVEFSIPQHYFSKVHKGHKITLELENQQPFTGKIQSLSPNVDKQSRALTCRAIIENKDHTIPSGATVKIQIPVKEVS